MEQFDIPFGISGISISIADSTKKEKLQSIKKLLHSRSLYLDSLINEHDTSSTSYKINTSDVGIPLSTSSEYIDYLKRNIELTLSGKGLFSSYEDKHGEVIIDPREYYKIEKKALKVTKEREIYFKANTLLDAFVISELASLLTEEKIKNFLIYTENTILAHGKDEWHVEIKEPVEGEILAIPVQDTCFCIAKSDVQYVERATPFSHVTSNQNLAAGAQHKDILTAKFLSLVALKLLTADQLQRLATQWESEITAYYPEAHYVFGN